MDVSPFPYQGPLDPDAVRGRDDLVDDLVARVTEHRVTALLGPRRFGKTSVLRRVASLVEAAGVSVVWIDLYEVTSTADVAVRFDEGLGASPGRFASVAARIAGGLELNLGLLKVDLRRPVRERPEPALTLHALLDVLVRAALETPTVVVIDEFSSIARVDGASGLLRTALQHHYRELGLVFAGSEPSMMRTLFTDREEPFYGQADLVGIGPLPGPVVAEMVDEGFVSTRREPGPVGARIVAFAGGHPQRSMQLADACWRHTPDGGEADESTWEAGLDDVRRGAANGLERLYSNYAAGEKAVLRIVAGGGAIFGSAADLLELHTGTAQHARRRLLERGDLLGAGAGDDGGGGGDLRVTDPLFADWLRRRFPL